MHQRFLGILNVNKPKGLTSRDVVDVVQRIVWPDKVGHAGTLDPLATGVLVLCVGRATRLIEHIQARPKQYRATFLLGRTSPTDDVTGDVTVTTEAPDIRAEQIEALLPKFTGRIKQTPPEYSAVHVAGERAYKRARRGEAVPLKPRTVEVFDIRLVGFSSPEFTLEIRCGTGTYIRAIGRDLGQMLGCGAVMSELMRTAVGPYSIQEAVAPSQVTAETVSDLLLPLTTAVAHLRQYCCTAADLEEIRFGRTFDASPEFAAADGEMIALLRPDGPLAAMARYDAAEGRLAPKRVFVDE